MKDNHNYELTMTRTDEPELNRQETISREDIASIFPFLAEVAFDDFAMRVGLVKYEIKKIT